MILLCVISVHEVTDFRNNRIEEILRICVDSKSMSEERRYKIIWVPPVLHARGKNCGNINYLVCEFCPLL